MTDIILTGPKHCGKTSAGKVLASLCLCDFIDLDELILQRTGKTPRQLYNESPEIFQKAEAEAVKFLFDNPAGHVQRVIAAGGGTIDNHEAVDILKNSGAVVVYLNICAAAAWRRIASSGDGRLPPFLITENPQETHRFLHNVRACACRQLADFVIETEGKTPQETAIMIANILLLEKKSILSV